MVVDTTDDHAAVVGATEIDGEPFGDIVTALGSLGDDERMLLVNSFEPVPLYDVLDERGFAHETSQIGDDEWHVEIEHA